MMDINAKIYVAGHNGLTGSAICRCLKKMGYTNLVYKTHSELDLTNQGDVYRFFEQEKPEYVILSAAKVGGIMANDVYRADFIFQNLQIQNNVIHASYLYNVKKLLFLGTMCIYPKNAPQPLNEEYLLTSELEYTNEPYAIAKISGLKMCESYNLQYGTNFISLMPTSLYGINDNFNLEKSHVIPALIRKMHLGKLYKNGQMDKILSDIGTESLDNALNFLDKFGITKKSVNIWGTGKQRREFLHVDDMADACIFAMNNIDFKDLIKDKKIIKNTHINVGVGIDISIKECAEIIKNVVGYDGDLVYDTTKPDGTMQKVTDCSKLTKLGWSYKINFKDGLKNTYDWYIQQTQIRK